MKPRIKTLIDHRTEIAPFPNPPPALQLPNPPPQFSALTAIRHPIYQHGQYFDREYTMLLTLMRYIIIEYDLCETNSIPS